MIDYFALALTHALIVIALLRILMRVELDREAPATDEREATPAPPPQGNRRHRRRRGPGDA